MVQTVEANTSSGKRGSQWNGDGIWLRRRIINPFGEFRMHSVVPVNSGVPVRAGVR